MNTERIMAFIRFITLIILTINSVLTAKGMNPIPFDEAIVTEVAVYIANGIAGLWAWWKNNNVTKKAINNKLLNKRIAAGLAVVTDVESVEDEGFTEGLEVEDPEVE